MYCRVDPVVDCGGRSGTSSYTLNQTFPPTSSLQQLIKTQGQIVIIWVLFKTTFKLAISL
jgi:hypothetical protein